MTKKVMIIVILASLLSCLGKENNSIYVEDGILIEQAIITTSISDGSIEKFEGYILTDKELIVYSGKQKPKVKGNYTTIYGKGKYVIPGLIDSHVHLANIAGFTWEHQEKYPQLVEEYFNQLPKSFLYYGYTTLIDVNNYAPNIINRISETEIHPDIYTCGQQIQVMNDFMMEMEELPLSKRYQLPFLYDKYNKNIVFPDSINLNTHSASSIIKELSKKNKNKCIKTLYENESSGLLKSWELPSSQIIQELVKEAHKEDMQVLLHAPSYEGQKFGIKTNVDIMAHSMWNWFKDPTKYLDTIFPKSHQDVLLKIISKRVGYQLTFRTIYGEIDLLKNQFMNDSELKNVFSESYLKWLKTEEAQWGKRKIEHRGEFLKVANPDFYNTIRSKFKSNKDMFDSVYTILKRRMNIVAKFLSDKNANLLFATDGVAMNMNTNPPGYNGYLEMNHWLNAGVSLENIFKAATLNNAKAFHIDDQYGTLEKGKVANILILDKNPLLKISAYNAINSVILRGKKHNRDKLSAVSDNK